MPQQIVARFVVLNGLRQTSHVLAIGWRFAGEVRGVYRPSAR
jgi:hypothetical protein